MLSKALTQLFERARARFGVDIEILDESLTRSYPAAETDVDRAIRESSAVRQTFLECMKTGRVSQVVANGERYEAIPLRQDARSRRGPGLAALRLAAALPAPVPMPEFWADFVRAAVEADAASLAVLSAERDRARRLLGTLRFLGQLVHIDSEADLAHALIQAAAVWFDADARVYQQDLNGGFVLYAALPGAVIDGAARRLTLPPREDVSGLRRTSSSSLWDDARDADVILVPLNTGDDSSGVLALIGAKLPDATELPVLGQIAGAQVERCRASRRERVQQRFLDRTHHVPPDAFAAQIVRDLVAITGAGSAALTLESNGQSRTLVTLGTAPGNEAAAREPQGGWELDADGFRCEFPLSGGAGAVLEMRPAGSSALSADHAMVTRVAAHVLSTWLRGARPGLVGDSMALAHAGGDCGFLQRIDEELERAKRFDLHLSLVVIDMPPRLAVDAGVRLQETLRAQLRGSDVLGSVGFNRVAALLTHTDGSGSHRVVERLRRQLAESTTRLRIAGVIIGHAEFSPEFRTADALVLAAARDAMPIASLS